MRLSSQDAGIRARVTQGLVSFGSGLQPQKPQGAPAPDVIRIGHTKAKPAATGLPTTDTPPKQSKTLAKEPTPSESAIAQATSGNAYKLVTSLVKEREQTGGLVAIDGKPTLLGTMASAIAASLGIPLEVATELVDAMSRGGVQAKAIATGLATFRAMERGERAQWLQQWLPAASAAAQGIFAGAPDTSMESLGATDAAARAFGDLAGLNFLMANRNVTFTEDGKSVAQRAEELRARAERQASLPQAAEDILADVKQIDKATTAEERQRRFDSLSNDLALRYGVTYDMAAALVKAMRSNSQVGRMIAEGLNGLESLDRFKGQFAESFFWTAIGAANAEHQAFADPFSSTVGVMSESEAGPVGALADFNHAMAEYKKARDREAKNAALDAQKAAAVTAG